MIPDTHVNLLPGQQPILSDWIRVTYRDTDKMGVVYYGNYLVWLEIGRTEVLRQTGTTYRVWEAELGVYLPVRECQITYRLPARYDDLVRVATSVIKFTRAGITFRYKIVNEDNALLAEATTTHVFTDVDGRIVRRGYELLPYLVPRIPD